MVETMPAPRTAAAPQAPARQSFSDFFFEIKIVQHRWQGTHQLKGGEVVLKDKKIEKGRTRPPSVALIPDRWNKQFNDAYRAVDKILAVYTMPFGKVGRRVVPKLVEGDFAREVAEASAALKALVDRFVAAYDQDVVAYAEDFWLPQFDDRGEYMASVGRLIPAKEELHERFSIELQLYEPTAAATGKFGVGQREVEDFYAQSRGNAQREVEAMVIEVVTGPRKQFAEALQALGAQITSRDARITTGSFTNVLNAIELCLSFSAVADDGFADRLRSLRGQIGSVVSEATQAYSGEYGNFGDTVRQHAGALNAAFSEVIATCRDEHASNSALSRFGVPLRRVR